MTLYHTSNTVVSNPDLIHSRDYLDFGKGFYLTSIKEQAVRYADRFLLKKQRAFLSEYVFLEDFRNLSVKTFNAYDEEWLDFVLDCRRGVDTTTYDLAIGGIANDKVFRTIDLFFSGDITKDEALKRLMFEKPNIQYCLRSNKALANLHFSSSQEIIL